MSTHPYVQNIQSTGTLKPAAKAVIIGRFPPIQTAQSLESMRLSLSYLVENIDFQTITGAGPTGAQIKFSVKSRAKFAKARKDVIEAVTASPRTTLFCDLFTHPTLQSKIRYHRLLERIRLTRLLWATLIHANDLSVVHSNHKSLLSRWLIKIAQWKRKRPIHSLITTGAAQRLIKRANHPALPPFEFNAAVQKLNIHSQSNLLDLPPAIPSNLSICGLANSPTGLGQNARMSTKCFQNLGLSPCLIDIETHKWQQSLISTHRLSRPVHLHHTNADRVSPLHKAAYNIGYLLWEFQALPKEHITGLSHLDEIWTPSTFVTDIYTPKTDRPVITMKKGLETFSFIQPNINQNKFTFLNAFDFHSSVERKNPLASVQAFQIAFPAKSYPECQLILKTTPTQPNHWGDPNNQMDAIRRLSTIDKRIIVIESYCDTIAFHQMIADADAVISTHRAEGFGYIPAYALSYARPVITTQYGGVTDFCTNATATLLPSHQTRVPTRVPKGHSILETKNAFWAQVDPDMVAEKMLWVYNNRDSANVKAHKGRLLMQTEYSITAQARRYRKRLYELGFWDQKTC